MIARESIRPHLTKDGTWYVRAYLGKMPSGRVVRPYREFPEAASEEEAVEMALEWLSTLNADGRVSGETVHDIALDFISRFEKLGKSPNTAKTYRTCLNWIDPYIGRYRAADVTAADITDVEWALLVSGGKDKSGLCASSVQRAHWFLSSLWKWMARAGIVEYNVVSLVDKPSYITPEAHALSEADMSSVVAEISIRMEAIWSDDPTTEAGRHIASNAFAAWIALHTGMRCGEVCALRIRDFNETGRFLSVCGTCIDTDHGTIRRPTTKGRKNRSVSLSKENAATISSFVDRYRGDAKRDDPMLLTESGIWPSPETVSAAFGRMCRDIGVKATFHTLRHTHATWLIASGVPVSTVSKRLGHSKPSVTMDIYDHAMAGDDDRAALVMDSLTSDNAVTTRSGGP